MTTIQLKPDLERMIQEQIERGGYTSVEEFVERAVHRLSEEEAFLHENKTVIDEKIGAALASLDRGEKISAEESRARLQKRKAELLRTNPPRS